MKPWSELTTDCERNAQLHFLATGDDGTANTEERLAAAATSGLRGSDSKGNGTFSWNGHEYKVRFSNSFNYGYSGSGNYGHGLWFYHHRHGEPWQADLEAHVAAWRAEPPDYLHDANLIFDVLLPACRERGIEFDFRSTWDSRFFYFAYSDNGHTASGDDPRRVLCEAIYEALRQQQEEQGE